METGLQVSFVFVYCVILVRLCFVCLFSCQVVIFGLSSFYNRLIPGSHGFNVYTQTNIYLFRIDTT